MPEHLQLGDLQLAILRVLWSQGECTVTQVHQALHDTRGLAPTTISTMLTKMEHRGLVAHRVEGRRYVYRASLAEGEAQRNLVRGLVDRVFLGDPAALVSHLLREGDIDAAELDALRRRIEDHRAGSDGETETGGGDRP